MKLVKQEEGGWEYALNKMEGDMLTNLLKKFPFSELVPVQISKTDLDSKAAEREKLLNESLAEHRKDLKKRVKNLLAEKFKKSGKGYELAINSEEREMMLQILNDIRVGFWIELGKPEELEPLDPDLPAQKFARYSLMNLAGYFEHHLISQE